MACITEHGEDVEDAVQNDDGKRAEHEVRLDPPAQIKDVRVSSAFTSHRPGDKV